MAKSLGRLGSDSRRSALENKSSPLAVIWKSLKANTRSFRQHPQFGAAWRSAPRGRPSLPQDIETSLRTGREPELLSKSEYQSGQCRRSNGSTTHTRCCSRNPTVPIRSVPTRTTTDPSTSPVAPEYDPATVAIPPNRSGQFRHPRMTRSSMGGTSCRNPSIPIRSVPTRRTDHRRGRHLRVAISPYRSGQFRLRPFQHFDSM
jgi:hypothetical protein